MTRYIRIGVCSMCDAGMEAYLTALGVAAGIANLSVIRDWYLCKSCADKVERADKNAQ